MSKNDKVIIEWLHILLSKNIQDVKEIMGRIAIINHQIENFTSMHPKYQQEVISDLIKDIEKRKGKNDDNWDTAPDMLTKFSD